MSNHGKANQAHQGLSEDFLKSSISCETPSLHSIVCQTFSLEVSYFFSFFKAKLERAMLWSVAMLDLGLRAISSTHPSIHSMMRNRLLQFFFLYGVIAQYPSSGIFVCISFLCLFVYWSKEVWPFVSLYNAMFHPPPPVWSHFNEFALLPRTTFNVFTSTYSSASSSPLSS